MILHHFAPVTDVNYRSMEAIRSHHGGKDLEKDEF